MRFRSFLYKILIKLLGDDEIMMALLIAQRVILGKMEFDVVTDSLKPQVYEHLKDSGVEFLAGDYTPPTAA